MKARHDSRIPDISIVVNAHREGLIAVPTLKSLVRAKRYAEQHGRAVEIIVCLDRADEITRATVKSFALDRAKIFEVEFGDLGLSRNFSVSQSAGKYVAFLDADDLFGESWIEFALRNAERDQRDIVWHTECNLYFGDLPRIVRYVDMEDTEFDALWLVCSNPWTALCMADRSLFERFPYPKTELNRGVGYEDWGWYREVIDAGWLLKTVKGTSHAIRVKQVSLVKQTTAAGVFPAATNLFRRMLEKRALVQDRQKYIAPPR